MHCYLSDQLLAWFSHQFLNQYYLRTSYFISWFQILLILSFFESKPCQDFIEKFRFSSILKLSHLDQLIGWRLIWPISPLAKLLLITQHCYGFHQSMMFLIPELKLVSFLTRVSFFQSTCSQSNSSKECFYQKVCHLKFKNMITDYSNSLISL